MIQHVVLWKLLDEANGMSKEENCRMMCEGLTALPTFIPQIMSLSVVKNEKPTDKNMDIALITTFASFTDLEIYSIHPEHVKMGRFVGSVVSARAAIDYEL